MDEPNLGRTGKRPDSMSVSGRVSLELQRRILEGEVDTGAPLAPERTLAKEFGVSRTSIREAIAVLAASGLVSVEHGRGVFVRARAPDQGSTTPLNWQFDGRLSLRDAYQMRMLAEPYAVWMLTHVVSREIVTRLEDNLAHLKDAYASGDFTRASSIDFEFHWMFVEPLGNEIFCDLLKRSASILPTSVQSPVLEAVAEHGQIIANVRKGDADAAAAAMQQHVVLSARRAHITLRPPDIRRPGL